MRNKGITPCTQPTQFKNAKKCGAKTRKTTPCQSPAMLNGRCRMHGGKSTGVRTEEGIERIRKANFRNGLYTKEAIADRQIMSLLIRESKEFLKYVSKDITGNF